MAEIIVTLGDSVIGKYPFSKDVMTVGRSRDSDVVIANLAVSRNHAQIRMRGSDYLLSDLNSTNGTYINGVRVTRAEVKNGDVITIGKHVLLFKTYVPAEGSLDAYDEERTIAVEKDPVGYAIITRGKQKDLQFRIDKAEVSIGRGADCDISLHDWFASKQHAVIHRRGSSFVLRDLGSWRGTKVNDVPVTEAMLKNGDEIHIGSTRLTFRTESQEPVRRRPVEELATPLPSDRGVRPLAGLPFEDEELGNGHNTPIPGVEFAPSGSRTGKPEAQAYSVETIRPLEPAEHSADEASRDEESDEDAPILAGSEMDFIELSRSPVEVRPSKKDELSDMLFPDLEAMLGESVSRVAEAVKRPPAEPEMVGSEEMTAEPKATFEDLDEMAEELRPLTPDAWLPQEFESPVEVEPAVATIEPAALSEVGMDIDEESPDELFPPMAEASEARIEQMVEVIGVEPAPEPAAIETPGLAAIETLEPEPIETPKPEPAEAARVEGESEYTEKPLNEIRMWEEALRNRSPLIRGLAAKTLKKLTGKDYEY